MSRNIYKGSCKPIMIHLDFLWEQTISNFLSILCIKIEFIIRLLHHYTKYDIKCLITFSVVTTLSCSTIIFNYLIISVRHKCVATFPTATSFLLLSLLKKIHILTNTKFVHVISTYYHSWYLVFEFTLITFIESRGVHCTKHVRVYVSAQKGY